MLSLFQKILNLLTGRDLILWKMGNSLPFRNFLRTKPPKMLPAEATVRNRIQRSIINKAIQWISSKESYGSLKSLFTNTEH